MPGAQLLQLPTVVVDTTRFSGSSSGAYDTMTLFSCIERLGIVVDELVFAGRTPEPGATAELAYYYDEAQLVHAVR